MTINQITAIAKAEWDDVTSRKVEPSEWAGAVSRAYAYEAMLKVLRA